MKRKICKILIFFVLIIFTTDLQSQAVYDKITGNNDKGYCIGWVEYESTEKIKVKLRTWGDYNATETDERFFNNEEFELEFIDLSEVIVGNKIKLRFHVRRGLWSEDDNKWEPKILHNKEEVLLESSLEKVDYDWINEFTYSVDIKPLKTGTIEIYYYGDDDNKTVIKITLYVGDVFTEPENEFTGIKDEDDIDYWKPTIKENNTKMITLTGKILGSIQALGSVMSVGVLVVLGIKYMFASLEEKASYKQSLILYVVGCAMVFGVVNITKIIYDIAVNL